MNINVSRPASDWINNASVGQSTVYFRGDLAKAAHGDSPEARAVAALRKEYWRAYEFGLVNLVQRKHGFADYSYIAQKRSMTATV